jgi:hypothetical protein
MITENFQDWFSGVVRSRMGSLKWRRPQEKYFVEK